MPASPSRAETSPSCITPAPERLGSSSCSASTPPHSRWYCSALRRIAARWTGLPSSVKPSAPASASSAISVSASPASPRVIEARKPTGMRASRRAASRSERSTVASSTTGSVFGIATTATKPPAAAARVPESRSSLCSWPGTRRCTCGSTKPGNRWRPSPSSTSAPSGASSAPGAPSSAITPPRTSTSCGASIPLARVEHVGAADQQVGGRLLAVHERLGAARRVGAGGVHAVTSWPVGRGPPGEQLVEHRHPHDDAGRDLLADHRLRRVDHLGGELDAAVDRAGVHEHLAGAEPAAVDLVARGVLAQAGHERLGHALLLHPQRVDDVGLVEPVERVADLAAERLHPARDQRRRAADGHAARRAS